MIRMLERLSDNVVALEAIDSVSADGLRVLYLRGDEFDGFDPDASLEDMKITGVEPRFRWHH
jgi:hypothetical protein